MKNDAVEISLLLTPPCFDEEKELGLPHCEDNIFARIIRDPTNPERTMRERRCTELLCGLLRNVPTFRNLFISWLSEESGISLEDCEELNWKAIDTELTIDGRKRIDLVLEGKDKDSGERTVLWPVEVKVSAVFHPSSRTHSTEEATEDSEIDKVEIEYVNQIENYDFWLSKERSQHKAGFVLAMYDMTSELPKDELKNDWHCLTWGQLSKWITTALENKEFQPIEQLFMKHFLGFINTYLRGTLMDRLDFNAISFLKAYSVYKDDCESVINNLVAPICNLFENSSLKLKEIKHCKDLFKKSQRSTIVGSLGSQIDLIAGYAEDWWLWIETNPKNPLKSVLRNKLTILSEMSDLNLKWELEEDESGWWVIMVKMPLTKLLDANDQAQVVQEFVSKGIEDLEKIGLNAIIDNVRGK